MNLAKNKDKIKDKARDKSKDKEFLLEYGKVKGLPGLVCVFRRSDNGKISRVLPFLCEVFDELSEKELLAYIKNISEQIPVLKAITKIKTITRVKTGQLNFLMEDHNAKSLVPLELLDLDDISDFALSVYKTLYKTRFGETLTYSELARRAGHKGSARAVGSAMRKNPLPIIIPCHRVGSKSGVESFSISCLKKKPVDCKVNDSKVCAIRIKTILKLAG